MARSLVIDACCTLNLLATRREVEIVSANDLDLIISEHAHGEAIFLHTPPDDEGVRTKEPASTKRLRGERRLQTRALDTELLLEAFVRCATKLRDEDASCVALAGVLGVPLMTDDGKERRVARELFPEIDLVSTLEVLHGAVKILAWPEEAVLRMATDLRWGGNFMPPRRDPLSSWYADLLQRAGVAGNRSP